MDSSLDINEVSASDKKRPLGPWVHPSPKVFYYYKKGKLPIKVVSLLISNG